MAKFGYGNFFWERSDFINVLDPIGGGEAHHVDVEHFAHLVSMFAALRSDIHRIFQICARETAFIRAACFFG